MGEINGFYFRNQGCSSLPLTVLKIIASTFVSECLTSISITNVFPINKHKVIKAVSGY